MFSVVIPLYNKEVSVKNTLESVLNQTFKEFEIVIVNDGSTDNSLEIVKKIKDDRIRIIDKPNGGVSSARNRGIKEAKYEWIAFLDADDLWMKDKLRLVNNAINTNESCELILHAFETNIIHKNKVITNIYKKEQGVLLSLIQAIVDGLKIQTSAVVVKKSLFEKNNDMYFRVGVNNSEDREVWYKLACLKVKTIYLPNMLSKYVVDDNVNSLTGNKNRKYHFLKMEENLSQFLDKLNDKEKAILVKHIRNFNTRAIKNYYVKLNKFPKEFQHHLSSFSFNIFKNSAFLPKVLKKALIKTIRL